MGRAPRWSEEEVEQAKGDASEREPDATLPNANEREVQRQLFTWAEAQSGATPELSLLFAVPNGQVRPGIPLEPGLKSGVPDLFLPVASGPYHGLFLELKREGGRLRDEQEAWLIDLADEEYGVYVAYGFADAKHALTSYLDDPLTIDFDTP